MTLETFIDGLGNVEELADWEGDPESMILTCGHSIDNGMLDSEHHMLSIDILLDAKDEGVAFVRIRNANEEGGNEIIIPLEWLHWFSCAFQNVYANVRTIELRRKERNNGDMCESDGAGTGGVRPAATGTDPL